LAVSMGIGDRRPDRPRVSGVLPRRAQARLSANGAAGATDGEFLPVARNARIG